MRWVALSLVVCASSAFATEEIETVDPFVLDSGGVKVAGEVHSLNPKRCTAVIAVGGSNARTRADTAVAVQLLLGPDTAVVLMDRRGNGLSTGGFEVPDTKNTAWQIPRFSQDVARSPGT